MQAWFFIHWCRETFPVRHQTPPLCECPAQIKRQTSLANLFRTKLQIFIDHGLLPSPSGLFQRERSKHGLRVRKQVLCNKNAPHREINVITTSFLSCNPLQTCIHGLPVYLMARKILFQNSALTPPQLNKDTPPELVAWSIPQQLFQSHSRLTTKIQLMWMCCLPCSK